MTSAAIVGSFEPLGDRPSVSVALATYNGARFLQEQLDSLAAQTRLPDELVVSDDGSTDDTLAIVRRFGESAPFAVRVLAKDARLGFADNFLHAAGECRGDFVAFCDQDDVWLPDKLKLGLQRLVEDDSLMSMHRLTVTDEQLRHAHVHDQGIARDALFQPLAIDPQMGWGNTMMFRRELATIIPREQRPGHPGESRLLTHDTWLYTLAAALGRVSHIAEPLILYRQHGKNAAGVTAPSLTGRLQGIYVNPSRGFRLIKVLDEALAVLLADLAGRSTGDLRARASVAAACFAQRGARLGHRIAAYEGATALRRASAYLAVLRSLRHDPATRRKPYRLAAKDLVLGVTGFDRRASAGSPT